MDYPALLRKIKSIPIFLLAILEHWFLLVGGVVFGVASNYISWLDKHIWLFPILGLLIAIYLAWYSEYKKASDLNVENIKLTDRATTNKQLRNPEQLKILVQELEELCNELNVLSVENQDKEQKRNKADIFQNAWRRRKPKDEKDRNLGWIFDFEKWLLRLESYFSVWPDGTDIFKQLFVWRYLSLMRGRAQDVGAGFYSFGLNSDWYLEDDLYKLRELIKNMS